MFTFLQSSSLPSFDHFNISYGHKLSMSETVKPSVCGVTCLHICAQWSQNGGLILNTVARISTCGQQLFLSREDGLYMKLSLKLVLDRKQKKECGIQFCRKVRKPTTTRNHSARPVCTLLWRPTWHQKEPRQFKTGELTTMLLVCSSAASCIRLVSWLRYRWFSCSSRGAASLRGKHIKTTV